MASSELNDRTALAEQYAALARQAEHAGYHRRAADLYKAALFILYNYDLFADRASLAAQFSRDGALHGGSRAG